MTKSPIDDSPAAFFRRLSQHAPTPLIELPALAAKAKVARVYLKDESHRWLGSFKSLGGTYAGLRALARAVGATEIEELLTAKKRPSLPRLLCASDGNHGLAVAAGAGLAGATARVYLHGHVPKERASRITEQGAEIVWVDGTYDDAVDAARAAAERGEGLLIGDTSTDPDDPIVADVMAGYRVCAEEIVDQVRAAGMEPPTHVFVQAGVGGLAAAMAEGLAVLKCRTVVVEPEGVACVAAALRTGLIERLDGDLRTAAEMLSCGEASAPAVRTLCRHLAEAMTVTEEELVAAPDLLSACGGPRTTPSGATGIAGLLAAGQSSRFIDASSRVLVIATEGPPPDLATTSSHSDHRAGFV